jgi:hypothetical protein
MSKLSLVGMQLPENIRIISTFRAKDQTKGLHWKRRDSRDIFFS